MLVRLTMLACLLLSGCALSPSCSVGLSLFPPGPYIMCGADAGPEDDEEGE